MPNSSRPQPLAPRQRVFVEQYLVDLNGKEAAIRAGYTPDAATVRAAKLLRRVPVRQAVAAAMAARAARTGITVERVIAEYARIAFADWRRFADWGPGHVRFAARRALTPDDRAAVAEIIEGANGVRRVRLFDKAAALNSLLRILDHAGTARFPGDAASDAARTPSAPCAGSGPLSARQARFADEFLRDLDAGAAARRAGYAPRSAPHLAAKLRRHPGVAARIETGIAQRLDAIRVSADRVIEEYARIAFADIGRVADWDAKKLRLRNKARIVRADSAAIERLGAGRGVRLRVTLYDKVYALDALARHLGLLDARMPGRTIGQKGPVQRTSAALRARLGRG